MIDLQQIFQFTGWSKTTYYWVSPIATVVVYGSTACYRYFSGQLRGKQDTTNLEEAETFNNACRHAAAASGRTK